MMRNVVTSDHGTAHNIDMPEYPLAGKTGTCQTEYWIESNRYISSFVGYFPADKPEYTCIVIIHKPNVEKGYYGNIVAAPVFEKIAKHIYLSTPREVILQGANGISPEIGDDYSKLQGFTNGEPFKMPNVLGMPAMDAISVLENLGLMVEAKGSGKVVNQSIEQGKRITKGQSIKLQIT
jgi:cell division protein FtsI (penicillin-binding protein 3)